MSTRSEKKSTRLLYDRSGTRYWCIQTESTSIETNEFTIHKKEVENNSGNSIEEMPLESCLSELKNILESSTEFMEKRSAKIDAQIRITPNKIITETFSSPLNPKGEKSFTISEKQFGNVREWSSDDELEEELSIFKAIKERMTSEATEVKKNKEKKAEEMDISEENSIWRAKGMREERALAIGHWRTLPLKLQKKILKIDGDCKYFFTTHVKNKMKSTKGGPLNLKYHNCTCIECDPKRAFMQVQFEAFYTRYRVAQSLESSSRADKLEISSDKIFKEAAETKFFDGSVEDLKKKIYNIALQMIKDSGELYIEISKKLLYDQQKIMATYADEVNSISLAKSEGLSNERLRDGKLHFCVEHSKEKHQLDFPHYKIEKSSGRPVPCIENCDHTPLTSLAANMALAADMLGLSKQNGGSPRLLTHADDSNKKEKIPEDRAPFPAANPPEGMTSSWTRCGDKECYFNKPVIANSRNPDSKDEIGEEKIKIALKTSLDDETLMQIYVTKLFDHRIVNYYREMINLDYF
ncbi:hypothetical protein K502DRAFT_96522 [Neoconidiobolus thromboides FSU 785]|nr:hypothetical protein K502DRAFT_96522 [Neoconidiobolus thromboides FSU 785]